MQRIYLDNAATSWPKPPEVLAAITRYMADCGAAVGRGATQQGAQLQQIVDRCRLRATRLFNAESPQRVLFTFNGTDSLNLALHGLLRPGDHVVTTDVEHNSVLRPLSDLARRQQVEVSYLPPGPNGILAIEDLAAALRLTTRLVAVSHVSNVTGAIQPIAEMAALARLHGARVLIDAAQSAGHLPIDVRELGIDLLACPGHKGLLGPLGTGLLYVGPEVEGELHSVRQGGTGTRSEEDAQPSMLPDKYEAGNHNAVGLVGLEASLAWIDQQGLPRLREHEQDLTAQLLEGLRTIPSVRLFGPCDVQRQCGVVSLQFEQYEPQEAAAILDQHFGIEVRAGLHCAPRMHRALGTTTGGGTVRFSPGAFTTAAEIESAVAAVRELASA